MQILQSSDNLLCVFTILEEKENTVKIIPVQFKKVIKAHEMSFLQQLSTL